MQRDVHKKKTTEDGRAFDLYDQGFDKYLDSVKKNGNLLDFAPFFVHNFNELQQTVTCESFKITNRYVRTY
jgi:hypothetical protein